MSTVHGAQSWRRASLTDRPPWHQGRRLPEPNPPLLLSRDPLPSVDRFGLLVGAHGGRTLPDRFEPALEVREIFRLLSLSLAGTTHAQWAISATD